MFLLRRRNPKSMFTFMKKTENCTFHHLIWSPQGQQSACNTWNPGLISVSGRSPGEGNANPLQYSCLENSMNRGAWLAIVHGVAKSGHDWVANTTTAPGAAKLLPWEQHTESQYWTNTALDCVSISTLHWFILCIH